MPLLKDLSCSIELSDDQEPLQELGTMYRDAVVETFVPIPKEQQTFTVHLSGRNFIAPGIAMYVFIDGVYQCNRNRQNMKLRRPLDRRSLVDFKVRQKEERQKDGSMVAREWTFEKLDYASADGASESCSPNILENLGCIEVVVLRCAGPRTAKTATNLNMDGAADYPNYRFDRESRSRTTAYDDRDPFVSITSNKRPPPPPVPKYRSPYAETVRSRERSNKAQSRYSEPVSPGTCPQRDIPAPGFQYGYGPLPARSTAETYKELINETPPSRVSKHAPTVDSGMLEKLIANAVKRGVEESSKSQKPDAKSRIGSERCQEDLDGSSQVPGAWPTTPTTPSKHRSNKPTLLRHHERGHGRDNYDRLWAEDTSNQNRHSMRSRAATRVGWDEEPEWDKQTKANGWDSPDEESWETDELWPNERPEGWEEVRRRSRSRVRTVREPSPPGRVSHTAERSSQRQRLKHGRPQKSRFKSRSYWVDDMKTSSDDNDSWTQVQAPSDTITSLGRSDSTLKPSHSRSQIQQERSSSVRKSSRRGRSQSRRQRRSSQLIEYPQFHTKSMYNTSPPSMLVTNAPTMASAPTWRYPGDVRPRKPSVHTQIAMPVTAPPPTWGCASEKARKNSAANAYSTPAPFSTVGEECQQSRNSSGSSSWGVENKRASKNSSERKSSFRQARWGEDKKSDKASGTWKGANNTTTGGNDNQAKVWGDNDVAEQNNDGWYTDAKGENGWVVSNDTDEKPVDGWNMDNNTNANWDQADTQDAAANGFDPDSNNNAWGNDDTSKEGHDNDGGFNDTDNNGWGAAQDTTTAWDQPQDTTNDVPFNADTGAAWAAQVVVDEKANENKPPSASKRHTIKSLSKYRQLSSASLANPHWKFPPPAAKKILRPTDDDTSEHSGRTRRVSSVPSEPLYKVPKSAADEKGVEHQVLAGPGTAYGHAISRPEYIDRLDKPYAVFRFKYRSRSVLKGMFGSGCLSKTGTAPKMAEKEDLKALPQEELIKKMLALQMKLAEKDGKDGDGESQCTESVAKGLTEKWVQRHSREASEKGKKARTEKSVEKVAGWDDGAKAKAKGFDPEKVVW